MKRFILLLYLVLLPATAWSATYYVNQTGGDDAKNGRSTDNAWKTIAKVNGSSFSAGDHVLFKKGETWSGDFVVSSSGGIGNPITFGTYGSGNPPIINAGGSGHYAALVYNVANITLDGLRFRNGTAGAVASIVDNITIQNCIADNNISIGIGALSSASRVTTKNSTAYNNGGTGIYYEAASGDVTNGLIDNCTAYSNGGGNDGADPYQVYGGGIRVAATPPWGSGLVIQNSNAYNNGIGHTGPYGGHGIWVDAVNNPIVRYNTSHGNLRDGIFAEALGNGGSISYNLSYSNGSGVGGMESGISVEGRAAQPSDNVLLYNNVAYGNTFGIRVNSQDNAANTILRTIVKNNLAIGNRTSQLAAFAGGNNNGSSGSGNVYTYNGFGPQASNFIMWGYGGGKSTYAEWETAYGGTTHSVQIDPLFVSTVTPDFHLQTGSPAIGKGTNVSLSLDYAGKAVKNPPSVGAYEFLGSSGTDSPRIPEAPTNLLISQR